MSELSKVILELIAAGYRVEFASFVESGAVVINVSDDDVNWSQYVSRDAVERARIDALYEELRIIQHRLATPTDAKERG